MAEFVTRVYVGYMHLYDGQLYRGYRVGDGVRIVGVCPGVDYYAGAVGGFVTQTVDAVDNLPFAI